MEKRVITVELLNKILQYLAQKPFIEVHQLIQEIHQLPPSDQPQEVKE